MQVRLVFALGHCHRQQIWCRGVCFFKQKIKLKKEKIKVSENKSSMADTACVCDCHLLTVAEYFKWGRKMLHNCKIQKSALFLQATRDREDLQYIDPSDRQLQREVNTEKFTVLVSFLFFLFLFLCSSKGGVSSVTVFNSSASWAATFHFGGTSACWLFLFP